MSILLALAALVQSSPGWNDDGSLFSGPGHGCFITKQVISADGKFLVQIDENRSSRTISVSSTAWSEPSEKKLPYMALKAGGTVLSDSALTRGSTSAYGGQSFGPGLIFKLNANRDDLVRLIRDNELAVWDARGPKRLLLLRVRLSSATLSQWRECGMALDRSANSDPFK